MNGTNMGFLNAVLKWVCERLNERGINYYVVGAIGAYLDAGLPLQRAHDDVDILIEEKDVEKLAEVFKGTDFELHDRRLVSEKVLNEYGYTDGEHEVYAQYKYGDFHIGFFLLRFGKDDYTIVEYFREGGVQKRLERTLPRRFFATQYNDEPVEFSGVKLKTARKEMIYKNKLVMGREKDIFDLEKLESTVEAEKLEKLKGLSKYRKTVVVEL